MTDDGWALALELERRGLLTGGIGPHVEWFPMSPDEFQRLHDQFWRFITDLLTNEPADYEQLPSWMTEEGTDQLNANN